MKSCKYCNATLPDSAMSCTKCGSSDLINKCNNCGAVLSTGFCSQCGVKAGEQAKTCPTCGKRFFSASCPDCGWSAAKAYSAPYPASAAPAASSPLKKKTSVWIVLLWIFFLPVMGCIAIYKSPKIDTKMKYILIGVIAVLTVFFGITGNKNNTPVESAAAPIPKQSAPVASLPAAAPTAAPTTAPTAEPAASDPPSADSMNAIAEIMQGTLSKSYSESSVVYLPDSNMFYAEIKADSIAEAAYLAKNGDEGLRQDWDYAKKSLCDLCDSMVQVSVSLGCDNPVVSLNLLNNINADNVLLSIANGAVIYDAVLDDWGE